MKRVVSEVKPDVVDINGLDAESKMYASLTHGLLYKLHKISERWAFCACRNTNYTSTGSHGTMVEAVQTELKYGPVYEFDNAKEFFRWALENQK